MLTKIESLTAANAKLQSKIDSQTGELTKAKEAGTAASAELQTKLQTQEVLIAELQMQVKYSGLLHEAFLKGMGMRMGAPLASPASSASTSTPPPPGAGLGTGFHMAGVD